MIFNLMAGGAGLNFKVVGGTTQPTNPKENTIWINTDAEITGWIFNPTEPSSSVEGMVWIETGITSDAPFNALKKNEINVYPFLARQYISGTWVEKDMAIYQNGAWIALVTDLYIIEEGTKNSGISASCVCNTTEGTPSAKTSGSYYVISSTQNGYLAYSFGPIDLTNYSTLKMEGSFSVTDQDVHNCLAVMTKSQRPLSGYVSMAPFNSSGASINVSSLTGKHYIGFACNYNTQRSYKIRNLYLIP